MAGEERPNPDDVVQAAPLASRDGRQRFTRKVRVRSFRAGDRVRVRETADSPYAGCEGVVVYVGNTVCDVRITVNRREMVGHGRTRRKSRSETVMETLPKKDLESMRRHVELIGYTLEMPPGGVFWPMVILVLAVLVALTAAVVF